MNYSFDLIVLGAGSGGLAAAKRAASYGARVAIVEGDRVGGTCVIRGCVPKKLLVYGSQYGEYLKNAPSFGVKLTASKIEPSILLKNVRNEVDRLNKLHIDLLEKSNVVLIKGWGSIAGPNSVVVKSKDVQDQAIELFAEKILIAVGGRPSFPEIPGASLGWTSDDVFLQEGFPDKVVVVGAGFIACEFACILNGLGVKVKQLVRGRNLLKNFDNEVAFNLQQSMESSGIEFQFASEVNSIEGEIGDLNLVVNHDSNIKSGAVIFATGRKPFIEGLNLEKVDIRTSNNRINVDNKNSTNISNIFAIGDVTDKVNLTPVAIEEGRVFADNNYSDKNRYVNYEFIPKAVFSQPELAYVGKTEEESKRIYGESNIKIYRANFKPMSKMLVKSKEKCFLKLIIEKNSNKVVGCHMLGEHASEIIQMAAISMNMGATKLDFDQTMALHPTISEEFVTMK